MFNVEFGQGELQLALLVVVAGVGCPVDFLCAQGLWLSKCRCSMICGLNAVPFMDLLRHLK